MSFHDFNPNFVGKHVAPAWFNDGTIDFPMDEVLRRLDGEPEPEPSACDNTQPDAAQVMRRAMEFLCKFRDGEPEAISKIGKRAIAACAALRIGVAKGVSQRQLSKSFKFSYDSFDSCVRQFSEVTGIKRMVEPDDSPPIEIKEPPEGGLKNEPSLIESVGRPPHKSADTYPDENERAGHE